MFRVPHLQSLYLWAWLFPQLLKQLALQQYHWPPNMPAPTPIGPLLRRCPVARLSPRFCSAAGLNAPVPTALPVMLVRNIACVFAPTVNEIRQGNSPVAQLVEQAAVNRLVAVQVWPGEPLPNPASIEWRSLIMPTSPGSYST